MQKAEVIFGLFGLDEAWLIEPRAGRALMWKLHQLANAQFDMSSLYPKEVEKEIEARHVNDESAGDQIQQLVDEYVTFIGDRAIVRIHGTLTKRMTLSRWYGGGGLTYPEIAALVQRLGEDDNVAEIWLDIDSHGGTVAGVCECADVIYEVAQTMPVFAFANDHCCSAAYWLACQANAIHANKSAIVGSIGVFTVLIDTTERDSNYGIKRHVVNSGGVKGLGADGSVTDDLRVEVQREVNEMQAIFSMGIARGRNITPDEANGLADGMVYIGESALARGLIDQVSSYRSLFSTQMGGFLIMDKEREESAEAVEVEETDAPAVQTENPDATSAQIGEGQAVETASVTLTAQEWAEFQAKQREMSAQVEKLERDRAARDAAVGRESIRQAISGWQAGGHLLEKHADLVDGLLEALRDKENASFVFNDETRPLYAHAIFVLNEVLTAKDVLVDFGERASSVSPSDEKDAQTEAVSLLAKYGVKTKTEVNGNGTRS